MTKPTHHRVTWHVYTTGELFKNALPTSSKWAWVAHGPRGSETGVEVGAEQALEKAYAAAQLLADTHPQVAA